MDEQFKFFDHARVYFSSELNMHWEYQLSEKHQRELWDHSMQEFKKKNSAVDQMTTTRFNLLSLNNFSPRHQSQDAGAWMIHIVVSYQFGPGMILEQLPWAIISMCPTLMHCLPQPFLHAQTATNIMHIWFHKMKWAKESLIFQYYLLDHFLASHLQLNLDQQQCFLHDFLERSAHQTSQVLWQEHQLLPHFHEEDILESNLACTILRTCKSEEMGDKMRARCSNMSRPLSLLLHRTLCW